MHASTDFNNDAALDCEYCDDSDFMGYAEANLRPLNGPHRVQMGWVSGGGVIDASGGGQFTLSPLNLRAAPLPQVARIVTPNGDPYYLSYRVGIGYDTLLSSTFYSPGLVGELSIHRWPGGVTNTRFIASLGTGESLPDAANGLTIIKNSDNGSSLTLTVAIGIQPPTNLKATAGDSQVALSWTGERGRNRIQHQARHHVGRSVFGHRFWRSGDLVPGYAPYQRADLLLRRLRGGQRRRERRLGAGLGNAQRSRSAGDDGEQSARLCGARRELHGYRYGQEQRVDRGRGLDDAVLSVDGCVQGWR
jgi:hypothetical protein